MGNIPNDYDLMQCQLDITQLDRIEAKLDELLARKKRVVKKKGSREVYSSDFNEAWEIYPKRAGGNPKGKAYAAFNKRITDGLLLHEEIFFELFQGLRRYARFCDATGKTGTEYVMQAATFFGPDKHYENDWTIPAQAQRKALPRNDADLEKFAVDNGLHKPGCAPQNILNMGQYRQWITERL